MDRDHIYIVRVNRVSTTAFDEAAAAQQHERDLYVIDENERHQVDTVSLPLYRIGEAPQLCIIYSLMGHVVRDGDTLKVTNIWPLRQEVIWDYQNNADFGIPVQTDIAAEKHGGRWVRVFGTSRVLVQEHWDDAVAEASHMLMRKAS